MNIAAQVLRLKAGLSRGAADQTGLAALVYVALLGAVIAIPQTIAFSTLAGMPVESGIALALLPGLVAVVFSKTKVLLSGPNNAVSVLLFTTASVMALPGSADYINLVLLITLFAGLFQLLFAFGRLGNMFLALPKPIVFGIVAGIGVRTIIQQIGPSLGVVVTTDSIYEIIMQPLLFDDKNYVALGIVIFSVAVGAGARKIRLLAKYSLLAAMLAGCGASVLAEFFLGADVANIEFMGRVTVDLLRPSAPAIAALEWSQIVDALHGGLAVAIVGSMQAIIMVQALPAARAPVPASINTDILGQALMNLTAPFVSAYAGATSFNRTFAHVQAGGSRKSHGAATMLLAFAMVLLVPGIIASVSMPAVTGVLLLIGWGLVTSIPREHRGNWRKIVEISGVAALTLMIGISGALIGGALLALYARSFQSWREGL